MSVTLEPTAPLSTDATASASQAIGEKSRVVGVDVARGLALVGMMATHAFGSVEDNDNPTLAHLVAGGRAATTFVLVAGVSLAFLSGGRTPVRGRERVGVWAGLAVRALLIGAIGLALGYLSPFNETLGILPVYGLLFLLAIPLLGSPPMVLIGLATALTALGPALIVVTAGAGLPYAEVDPTFSSVVQDPVGVLVQLFLTGEYPAVIYLAYLCVGLAIGRLDLRSRRLAWWLLGGGLALALAARAVSVVLLDRMGGLDRLVASGELGADQAAVTALLYGEADTPTSWWYLALPTPHSHTPIDVLHTLGSAGAVLGAALLLTGVPVVARVLSPLAAAGSMSLTLYSAHLVLLATGLLWDQPALLFLAMTAGALLLAWLWRRSFRQGPLEKLVAEAATATRRTVTRLVTPNGRATPAASTREWVGPGARRGAQFLAPVVGAGVLALTFWSGAVFAAPPGSAAADLTAAVADLSVDSDESGGSDAPEVEAPGAEAPAAVAAPAQPQVSPADPAAPLSQTRAQPAADVGRYCQLSEQLYAVEDAHPDQPAVIVDLAAAHLEEMPLVAPVEIRDAVTAMVADYRAEANIPGVSAPNDAVLEQAETAVEAFEVKHC
jgi:uncharacterized membrane protein